MKKELFKIIGVVLFIVLCGGLFFNNLDVFAKEFVIQRYSEATESSENDKTIDDLEQEKDDLEVKLAKLKAEQSTEFHANGFSEKYYLLGDEIDDIQDEIWDIEKEINSLEFEAVVEEQKETTKNNSIFKVSFVFLIPVVMFVVVAIIIIMTFVRNSRNMTSLMNGNSTKEMLNDLSEVAVKMAKDLNPTYKEFKCPNCGAALDPENTDIKKCNYCGAKLYKTVNTDNNHSHKTK